MHILWRRQWHLTPVLLPGKSHGQRSLVGCSPWGSRVSQNLLTENALHKPYCAKPKSEKGIIYSSNDCVFAKG